MAIYHCSVKPVSRSTGRSAPAAAAYRAGVELVNERDGVVHNYSDRKGVDHAEIVLPTARQHDWAKDRSALWNAAEAAERQKNSRVAREVVIALPHELTHEQRLELTRDFAQKLADRYGVAVDVAMHQPSAAGDERNVHAHLLMTTRQIEENGLGGKSHFEWSDKRLAQAELASGRKQTREVRELWEERTNEHLRQAGLEIRIDCRSHIERGLEIEPTQHQGVHASAMQRQGKEIERLSIAPDAAERNAQRILERPERVLEVITAEKSVFDHRDVARTLNRYVEPEQYQQVYAAVMNSPALEKLTEERTLDDGYRVEAKLTTAKMLDIESSMARHADSLAAKTGYGVDEKALDAVLKNGLLKLSEQQEEAVRHLAGEERIAAVVGFAGAGKSTMLHAAREAWEREGYRVHGAALSGKAAEGLEESSGIESRTLASWERSWENDQHRLERGDVLVLDEAGMVSSPQLERFLREADEAGAKIVLVGDDEQLQPIGPGAAFRAVVERTGKAELSEVRRQNEQWQRDASRQFGLHQTKAALQAYEQRGHIQMHEKAAQVREAIVRDYMEDMKARPEGSRLALAHRRADVQELNDAIRAARQEKGELRESRSYDTTEGKREFAAGDRILFRENDRDLKVKNGMLGTVERAEDGRLTVRLDNDKGPGQGRRVEVSTKDYRALDHGYAATIHKSQGATVDRVFVRASDTMDRHMTYVAMTRHREQVTMYAAAREFGSIKAEQAKAQMLERLSRSQVKETTLDYRDAYAGRRGFDPIVVPKDVQKEVQKEVQSSMERRAVELAPQAQRAQGLTDALRGMDDSRLLVELHRGGMQPHEQAQAVESDPQVKQAARVLAEVQRRDAIDGQYRQAMERLQQLEGKGFFGRLGSGAEREAARERVGQLRGQLEQVRKQLPVPNLTEKQAEQALSAIRGQVMQRSSWQTEYTVSERQAAIRAELARREPGRELASLADRYDKAKQYGMSEPAEMQRLSPAQRERVIAYAQASDAERGKLREQENTLGQQPGMQAIQPKEHQKQMERGGFER